MDKQEMVSDCKCGHPKSVHFDENGYCTSPYWDGECYEVCACTKYLPVEPAQPELPRELPMADINEDFIFYVNDAAAIQHRRDEAIYQQALKRIAELEAENAKLSEYLGCIPTYYQGKILTLEAEITSLKEQLAEAQKFDLRQYIPKGKYCNGAVEPCKVRWLLNCKVKMSYDEPDSKAPGCPVPAIEEGE